MSEMFKDAIISDDQKYRYSLTRSWDAGIREIIYIGINPSTADGVEDDATIGRLIDFTRRHGYGGFRIVNLYAFRTPDVKDLRKQEDPVGPDNWKYLMRWQFKLKTIVFCWGNSGKDFAKVGKRVEVIYPNALCFGHNSDGSPTHPLFLSKETKLIRYK